MEKKYLKFIFSFLLMVIPDLYILAQKSTDRTYVGERVCRECHHLQGNRDQYNKWRQSKHARAYSALYKPEAKEIAELSGIDIEPQNSPICLGCHTTAYNVEEWERDDSFRFEDGVQCELCHGPGSEYSDLIIMQNPEKAKQAGLKMYQERDCMICHKEKNSHISVLQSKKFEYSSAILEIIHNGKGGPLQVTGDVQQKPISETNYAGAVVCAECHNETSTGQIYSKWHQSRHADAYVNLAGDEGKRIAREMKVSGNAQESPICLKCHLTGKLSDLNSLPSGFDPLAGVQCESCHGPAGRHLEITAGPDQKNETQSGLKKVNENTCTQCHVKDIHGFTFDFDTYWPKINHSKWQKKKSEIYYKTPFNLAITRDGTRLFVACEASNSLIVVNTKNDKILSETDIGMQPHFVCFSPDESHAYVSNRASDNVSVIDADSYQVTGIITVGDEPHEMAVTKDGKFLYVANAGTYDVSVVDLASAVEIKRLAASRGPWGTAISPDGRYVYVTNNLPRYGKFRTTSVSEITIIDTKTATVKKRTAVPDANLVQGIAVSPDDNFALITLIRTKNLIPMTRNIQGWIITNGIGVLWNDGYVDQLLLDEVDDFFADPTDVVFSVDGKYAFVSGGGVQEVAMLDIQAMIKLLSSYPDKARRDLLPNHLGMSGEFVLQRIQVGKSPRGMAVSPDNRYLYVADGLDDAISVIDISKRERIRTIDLGGPKEITEARYGERIFHNASSTYARQFSCHSCHPDGGIDGLTYDIEPDGLGLNPVDNRTLRGINDTAPFKWTGKNPTLKRQCGPRLAAFFTRIDPFRPEQSAALDRYIVTIPRPPNRYRTGEELTLAQRRGKRIFERIFDNSGNPIPEIKRCDYCHTYPYFTSREKFDVGSSSWLDTHGIFDVPHLNNIYATPPYLHDGRANSLDEIWTLYNTKDTHGQTNDLTKDQLNDLIEFLKTL